MSESVLALFAVYGLPGMFAVLAAGQFGVPLPTSILLMSAGALAADGDISPLALFLWALAGAVTGDQAGYALGRFGGRAALERLMPQRWGRSGLGQAEALSARWGSLGIFFSRWLVSPLGPWINITSGIARYSWPRFLFWDVTGESIWIAGYAALGYGFSRSIAGLADFLANLGWLVGAVAVTLLLGWQLRRAMLHSRRAEEPEH
ncbi:DedA family protein [Chelativorans intermedius]|uniref:DedA family protein n=1 Tax=Chelativorans intermedius TaxID=515947 RepID=A0ABV6D6E9_9HYPH|nr:DedA family protein [Chelativorans intermedius]MCT8999467.1 DedA family protein [Chelativorans intermedius]